MFLSQNTLMGRVNIVFSLLSKGVVKDNFIRFASGICRKSLTSKGDQQYYIVALATMISNTGKVPLGEVLYNLIPQNFKFFSHKHVLAQAKIARLKQIIGCYFKGRDIKPGFMSSMTWAIFESDLKKDLIKKIITGYRQQMGPPIMERPHFVLCKDILYELLPFVRIHIECAMRNVEVSNETPAILFNRL